MSGQRPLNIKHYGLTVFTQTKKDVPLNAAVRLFQELLDYIFLVAACIDQYPPQSLEDKMPSLEH